MNAISNHEKRTSSIQGERTIRGEGFVCGAASEEDRAGAGNFTFEEFGRTFGRTDGGVFGGSGGGDM